MKLIRARITEFQSVRDSTEFELADITCLVGKNESGKTAVLQALHRLDPVVAAEGRFEASVDYPRADLEDYRQAVSKKERGPANVITATFALERAELGAIEKELGRGVISKPELTSFKGYENERTFLLQAHEEAGLSHLLGTADLPPNLRTRLEGATAADALSILEGAQRTTVVEQVTDTVKRIRERGLNGYIYDKYLKPRVPRFLYFDEYYQLRGHENLQALKRRAGAKDLLKSDHPMLGLISLARLDLDELTALERTEELVNKLEAASKHLSRRVMRYWSQNRHLEMRFDVREARPADPEGMREGTNIWAYVFDSRHRSMMGVDMRSRGFVWFFSFLAWYSSLQRDGRPLILLLDEPGLFLHPKAQMDLLEFFEAELRSQHQVIYTTHSPFMVDPEHWERIRIVQDRGLDSADPLPPGEEGTRVFTDVLEASSDSLFPLHGALGHEIHRTLFSGSNCLIVAGASDLLYLQAMSDAVERKGREGLRQGSGGWTITPVGGADKVPTFVALIGNGVSPGLATLLEVNGNQDRAMRDLHKGKLIARKRVFTYADFTSTQYADAEDMFDVAFYLDLVNKEYKRSLPKAVLESDLTSEDPRILRRLEDHFARHPMKSGATFSRYRLARHFATNAAKRGRKPPATTVDRFAQAFEQLNALLDGDHS